MKRLKLRLSQLKMICLLFIAYIVSKLIKWQKKYCNLWLISERGTDARDNGYHFFRYLREKHPEVNAYYVIDAQSADRGKVEHLGKTIRYRSFRHYVYFLLAEKGISSHIMGYAPDFLLFQRLDRIVHFKMKKVFLQHGVIKDFLRSCCATSVSLDLFVCGAKVEYEFVKNNFGFDTDIVQYLGLCRYDKLHDVQVKRQILLMPTWRVYIKMAGMNEENFRKTEYFRRFNDLLNNPRLLQMLKDTNCTVVFYPHYEFQPYLSSFTVGENVVLADFAHYDVQQLLKESALLITDYSSIYFDFAYMKKPMVYYQFDEADFYGKHYEKGYFDYQTMGFGKVMYEEADLVEEIIRIAERQFSLDPLYEERVNNFFPLHDQKNCERNFQAIDLL